MVRITEEMVRKRSEHNELQISTLEELSLHQQDIEKIEHLDKWCRDLKILYLQSNLIPKIENVSRLKKLEYLNLALNNVERIENLEGCESLNKLDLTVNFVGELTSIECLQNLHNFRNLYLTGNPCTDYIHYREFVVATLPQLQYLDGIEIEKSERIKSMQDLPFIRGSILEQQELYKKKRQKQKLEAECKSKENERGDVSENAENEKNKRNGRWYTDINEGDSQDSSKPDDKIIEREKTHEENVDEFWNEKVAYTPESRLDVHRHVKELKEKEDKKNEPPPKAPRRMFAEDGRPFNVNEAKVDFTITEDNENIILDVAIFKHMDTSLIDCDVQPNYVRISLKGKVLQLCLSEEVKSEQSVAKRSQTTGHLLVTMPKVKQIIQPKPAKTSLNKDSMKKENQEVKTDSNYLEVDASAHKTVDIGNIVAENEASRRKTREPFGGRILKAVVVERENSENFVDDPDVPPLV